MAVSDSDKKRTSALTALKVLERFAVLSAAFAAMFPFWQYYSEAGDRRVDRAANFILAQRACSGFFAEIEVDESSGVVMAEGSPVIAIPAPTLFRNITRECLFISGLDTPSPMPTTTVPTGISVPAQ